MKFYIAVDCEGVACSVGAPGGSLNQSENFAYAKVQASREANAAAKGLFAAGAEQVIIWDNHGGGVNLHYDLLDERCEIVLGGNNPRRFPGLDFSFSGVALIGYHPRDNTTPGVMAHSFSSANYQWMKVNGIEVGEIEIDSAICAERGVPVFFVSSDDQGAAQARRSLPGVQTYVTKTALGWNSAISVHPTRSVKEIEKLIHKAVEAIPTCSPQKFSNPLQFEIRHKRIDSLESMLAHDKRWERIDAYTATIQLQSIEDAF